MRSWFDDNGITNAGTFTDKAPPDRTWHHHQETGRMQLVRKDVHGSPGIGQIPSPTTHLGGSSLWGGSVGEVIRTLLLSGGG